MRTRPTRLLATATVAAALLGIPPAVAAADPSAHAAAYKLSGKSSQCPTDLDRCDSVTLGIASTLTLLTQFSIEYEANCPSGLVLRDTAVVSNLKTKLGKSQTVSFAQRRFAYDLPLSDGNTGHVTADVTGKLFKNGKSNGIFDAAVTITNPDGNEVERCSTGADWVTWTARTG